METKKIISVDLKRESYCIELINLMDIYLRDEMGLGRPMPEEMKPKIIKGLKNHCAYLGFFVRVGNEYAALANCNLNFSTWQAKPLINIHDFIVAPDFRRKGVGIFLLEQIEKYARKKEYCRVNLEVRHDNFKAQNLYKKAGYKECCPPSYFWETRWR